jgi:hypothetical protein
MSDGEYEQQHRDVIAGVPQGGQNVDEDNLNF